MRKLVSDAPWPVVAAAVAIPIVTLLRLPHFFNEYAADKVWFAGAGVLTVDIAVAACLLRGYNLARFGWSLWTYGWFVYNRDWHIFQLIAGWDIRVVAFFLQDLSPLLLFVPQANRFFSSKVPNKAPETNALSGQ